MREKGVATVVKQSGAGFRLETSSWLVGGPVCNKELVLAGQHSWADI